MRECDDLSDNPNAHKKHIRESIAVWSLELDRALAGDVANGPIWPAFHDTVKRYSIPHRFFHEMIDGVTSDLEPRRIQTFDELYRYCYQVASVVGLTVVHIFGFTSVRALLLAEKCGIAFQLTNILRDIREDAELDRVYLPIEDLNRYGVSLEQLRSGTENKSFRELMEHEANRAWAYYEESASLLNLIEPKSRRSLWALREIYMRLLAKIERQNFDVLKDRISIPNWSKIAILLRAFTK